MSGRPCGILWLRRREGGDADDMEDMEVRDDEDEEEQEGGDELSMVG